MLALLLLACTPWLDEFLTTATDRATQQEVLQQLGSPTQKKLLDGGGEVWSYHMAHASYAGGTGTSSCFQYVLTFDKQKILRKWNAKGCE
ncbi:MAG: hypothetical protein HY205_07170 [Nitrospirae bacterium]|nr:hypothetical protein [Nitrospirota bacterium]